MSMNLTDLARVKSQVIIALEARKLTVAAPAVERTTEDEILVD